MAMFAKSCVSAGVNSFETGSDLARQIREGFGQQPLSVILAYATVNHDQDALVRGIRELAGPGVAIIGCSGQGVMARGLVVEDGYVAGAMGLGGESLRGTSRSVEQINVDSAAKGTALGVALKAGSPEPLKVVIVHYDPLCGAEVDAFLRALHDEVACPLIGGAAAEYWGPMLETFQYIDGRVLTAGAVAVGLSGTFTAEIEVSHGTQPIGIEMTVTESQGNNVMAFDGRPALDVWQELSSAAPAEIAESGAIGIGLPTNDPAAYRVRCAFGVDPKTSSVIFQAGLAPGTRVLVHHRTVQSVLESTAAMGRRLAERTAGKRVRALLGFECGARTKPFLGNEITIKENLALQACLGDDVEWLGPLVWGEVFVLDGRAGFANFAYPVLVLAD